MRFSYVYEFTAPYGVSAVLCLQMCTLSASGGDLLNAFPPGAAPLFDVVVVDEAAQALEPATLIPLQLIKPGEHKAQPAGDSCMASLAGMLLVVCPKVLSAVSKNTIAGSGSTAQAHLTWSSLMGS